ncbi:hypothetical protein HanRHA438_Chr16g0749181 [Helianthus annuus]|nr:hypothetical protein HanRHA438_Chr16g0749181 [Helianthus annuus]
MGCQRKLYLYRHHSFTPLYRIKALSKGKTMADGFEFMNTKFSFIFSINICILLDP